MKRLHNFAAMLVVLAFAACAQFGQQAPQSAEDGLRYGQAVVTGAYKTVGDAAESRTLPADTARSYYNRLAQPKADLDTADKAIRALPAGATVPPDTLGKINAAVAILNVIADELRARLPATATAALPAKR